VTAAELNKLTYSVDILSPPRPATRSQLNPRKYGLIVTTPDGRRGLLLPDIPGITTAKEQIAIARRKAGISPDEKVTFQIFTVERHGKK
jgi:AMMECR1 domain-containing protein